jgi:tetratricopeptide (TPR) repeat protein
MMKHRLGVCSFFFLTCAFVCGLAAQQPTPQQITAWQRDPEVIRDFKMGRELRRAGKLAEAAAACDRVLKRAPGLALAYLNLGLVRHDLQEYVASTENSKEFSLFFCFFNSHTQCP